MVPAFRNRWYWKVILCLTIIAWCIAIVINFQPLYYLFVKQENLGQLVGLTNNQLQQDYQHLLNYLNFPWVHSLGISLPSSANALTHFADVKRLFLLDYVVLICGTPCSYWYLKKLRQQGMLWQLITVGQVMMTAGIFLSVMLALAFDRFFILFHEVLFRNNDWIFDPATDPIIDALPDEFFLACFALFFVLFLLSMMALIICGKRSLKTSKH